MEEGVYETDQHRRGAGDEHVRPQPGRLVRELALESQERAERHCQGDLPEHLQLRSKRHAVPGPAELTSGPPRVRLVWTALFPPKPFRAFRVGSS